MSAKSRVHSPGPSASSAARPVERAAAAAARPAPAGAAPSPGEAAAVPQPGRPCICALAGWQAVLFVAEAYHAAPGRVSLGAHALLAALVFIVTAVEEDWNGIPIVGGKLSLGVRAAKARLGKPFRGVLGSTAFIVPLSVYLCAYSAPLITTSVSAWTPFMWCSVLILSTVLHAANLVRAILSLVM